jgi:hypothetical protein
MWLLTIRHEHQHVRHAKCQWTPPRAISIVSTANKSSDADSSAFALETAIHETIADRRLVSTR